MNNWKEAEVERKKNKKVWPKKDDTLKPFVVGTYRFYPCSFPQSLEEGYTYFLSIKDYRGIIQLEVNSPRFKDASEAKKFADNNKSHPYVIN
jgi:hypothetical protein